MKQISWFVAVPHQISGLIGRSFAKKFQPTKGQNRLFRVLDWIRLAIDKKS